MTNKSMFHIQGCVTRIAIEMHSSLTSQEASTESSEIMGLSLDFASVQKGLCISMASTPPTCRRESGAGVIDFGT